MRDPGRFLKIDEVLTRVALSKSEVYRRIDLGRFPRPVKLAARAVVWPESEIIAWQLEQLNGR